MRLRRVELPRFGCLADFRAEFAPGLNVFFGENEAGKSTLQQAVCALLYGFFEGDRARPDETARHERFRPWPNGRLAAAYRGSLEYELEDGRGFEVRRDFSTADVPTQLIDVVTGADLASQYGHGRHGNVPFARKQLGMPRSVFQSCAFIGQGEVLEVSNGASPREIGDAIAALADSSRRDVSANAAIVRLDALLQRIGSDRARTAELPSGREALRFAEAELSALDTAQRAVAQKAAELQAVRARLAAVERDVTRGRVLFLRERRASLERKLSNLAVADRALAGARTQMQESSAFAQFPATVRDEVLRLRDRRSDAIASSRALRRELEVQQDGLTDDERLVYEGLQIAVGSLTADTLAELRRAAYEPTAQRRPSPNFLLRTAQIVVRTLLAVIRKAFRRRAAVEAGAAAVAPTVSAEQALTLLEKHTRYLMLRPRVEAIQAAGLRLREAEAALSVAESALRGSLSTAGISLELGLDEGVEQFLLGCAAHSRYQAAEAEADDAARSRRLLLGAKSPDELHRQLHECVTRLDSLLAANTELAGLEPEASPDEIAKRLEKLQEEKHALEVGTARLEEEVRSSLRDHRPRAEIEEDVERWRRDVARLEAARTAAQMAREVISEAMVAVYRDFAPAVNAFLSDGFEHITEGRYQRAHVDPASLRVSLLLPETGRVIMDPPVSRGTLTAAYILMRMGLAQHMSAIGEPVPLVLDDPFVDLDVRRLERMLEFILRITEQTQILLFTKDQHIFDWFERSCRDTKHQLHRLSGSAILTTAV